MNFFKKFNEKRKARNKEIENKAKEAIKQKEIKLREAKLEREKREKELEKEVKQKADNWKAYLLKQFNEHKFALYEEWTDAMSEDQYGNTDSDFIDYEELNNAILYDIHGSNSGFNSGFNYFFKRVIMRDISASDFNMGWRNYEKYYQPKDDDGYEKQWWAETISIFLEVMEKTISEVEKVEEGRIEAGFSEDMSGEDYEVYCGNILLKEGWNIEQTSKTNDQGVDLIGSISDLKICIQCKRYSNPVGNKAVQEIIAGKQFYGGTHAVVVSNAGFTKSAETLAKKTKVVLISDIELGNLEDYIE